MTHRGITGANTGMHIESKVVVFVNLMWLHAEAFSSTSESQFSRTCASLREWADEWDNMQENEINGDLDADSGNWHSLLDDWCGKLSSEDEESSKQSEANGYTSQRWKHLDKLHQIWQAEGFSQSISTILHLLSPGLSLKFLKSLCVRVPHDEIPVRLYQFADIACPVSVVSGRLDQGFKVKGGARQRILDELKGVAEEHPSRPAWWQITRNAHRSRVVCFYTTVQGVFGQKALDLDGVKISQAIIATSDIIDVHFATPFGQALVSCNWALAFPHFVWNRSADLLFQFLLVYYLSPDSRSRQEECEKLNNDHWNSGHSGQLLHPWVLTAPTAITILGLRTGVCMFIELVTVMAPVIWRCGDPLLRPRLFFIKAETLFCYVVELWSLWFAVCLWTVDDYICTRPFHLSMLIFVKWFQFMLSCLNFSFLIEHLLPAWVAMTSRQSILFLAYLVLTAAGTSMAYYALPIEEASEDNGPVWEWISAFVLTFRLDFLADFDDKDLEGVHQMVNSTNHQIEDVANPQAASFHWVLKVFTLACGLFFSRHSSELVRWSAWGGIRGCPQARLPPQGHFPDELKQQASGPAPFLEEGVLRNLRQVRGHLQPDLLREIQPRLRRERGQKTRGLLDRRSRGVAGRDVPGGRGGPARRARGGAALEVLQDYRFVRLVAAYIQQGLLGGKGSIH